MKSARELYNSMEPLKCSEFANQDIGVYVDGPFEDWQGRKLADVSYSTPRLLRNSYGKAYEAGEAVKVATQDTRRIIAAIDEATSERARCWARLVGELERLERDGIAGLPRGKHAAQPALFEATQ
jgi:hypothetical protein